MKFSWARSLATGETAEEALEQFYYEGRMDSEIASFLSVVTGHRLSETAVCQKRQAMGLSKKRGSIPLMKASDAPRYDQLPRADGDAVVLCDLHVPFHDATWCNRVIGLALLWEIPTVVLAGDILDMTALRAFAPQFAKEPGVPPPADLEGELEMAGRVFDALAGFEKVLYISGGHELRLLRKAEVSVAVQRFAKMFTDLPQVEMSAYHKCEIGDGWHISHPKNTSVIPGRVPFFLVRKYRKNCAIGHDHVWGMVQDESGRNIAISIGVCCDPQRLDYVALQDNTRPTVCQGALIIKNNYPWLLSPKWTDFRALRSIKW